MPKGVSNSQPKGVNIPEWGEKPYCSWPKCQSKETEWDVVVIQSDVGPLEVSVLLCRTHREKIIGIREKQNETIQGHRRAEPSRGDSHG